MCAVGKGRTKPESKWIDLSEANWGKYVQTGNDRSHGAVHIEGADLSRLSLIFVQLSFLL